MGFLPVKSVHSHVRFLKLNLEWNLKKNDPFRSGSKSAAATEDSQKSMKLEAIIAKLKAGKRLTRAELEFLRVHAPDLYAKAIKIMREQEAYESALRKCKTKAEVQRLHEQKLMELSADLKHGDPQEAEIRAGMIQATNEKFKKTDKYLSLDSEEDHADIYKKNDEGADYLVYDKVGKKRTRK